MTLGSRLRGGTVAAAVILLAAACTTGTADAPAPSAVTSPTARPSVVDPSTFWSTSSSPKPSAPSPAPTDVQSSNPSSPGISAQEAADRAAVEAQWIRLWDLYLRLGRIPENDRQSELDAVTASPLTEKLLSAATQANSDGVDNYGTIDHRLFWQAKIGSTSTATLADCQDQSQAGTIKLATGQTLTTGRSRNNLRGIFVRGDDGVWRAQQIIDLGNSDC